MTRKNERKSGKGKKKMRKRERVSIFIDGSNFYKYLMDKKMRFPRSARFDYCRFNDFLCRGRDCRTAGYYIGIARDYDSSEKSRKIVSGQQKFLANLKEAGYCVIPGRIMYDRGRIREKGTDVNIALDMVAGAYEDKFDAAVLVSSDTDLVPVMDHLRKKGKKVEYVGFSHNPSAGMQRAADSTILLRPPDIRRFVIRGKKESKKKQANKKTT